MEYQKSIWITGPQNDAYIWYSELDAERWEHRVIVEFRDGYLEYSSLATEPRYSWISEKPWPKMETTVNFDQNVLSQNEFENLWLQALKTGQHGITRQRI
ncbi:DUF6881 domain-containing protein [Asticcacaulis sp.]|jgi:hypothetical protein|uniref:DUF6881 domain-containing protein n=1 Tax=Asticcacaulis sp. TaxID=1872648 RepID=UPI0039C85F26